MAAAPIPARDEPTAHLRAVPETRTLTSFEAAYQRHYDAVVRSSWAIVRDVARAEELAQEAFVRAYARWAKLEDGGYAVPWLHRVVMNLSLSAVSRRRRGRDLEAGAFAAGHPPTTAPGPDSPDRSPDRMWLIETLGRLPARQREAVFLRFVADLPVDEVSSLMGCSPGAVKTHTSRGLDRLRQLIDAGSSRRGTDTEVR